MADINDAELNRPWMPFGGHQRRGKADSVGGMAVHPDSLTNGRITASWRAAKAPNIIGRTRIAIQRQ
jgi:hypothetical protein